MADADPDVDAPPLVAGFSSTKKRILLTLKRKGPNSLSDLAGELGISKMAVLKHMASLEGKGILQREFRAGGRGRPQVVFRLTETGSRLFPAAYTQMTLAALEFVEDRLGRPAVEDLLRRRTRDLYDRHRRAFEGKDLRGRVSQLAKIRDEGGYMAEVGTARKASFELLEHNCPIVAVAGKYGEACSVEQELFQKLLRADVDVSHRVVAGDPVCRFMIRKRRNEAPG